MIPHSHSEDLHANCPTESFLHMPKDMDHNEFQLDEDLVEPFTDFIRKLSETKPIESQVDKKENSVVHLGDSKILTPRSNSDKQITLMLDSEDKKLFDTEKDDVEIPSEQNLFKRNTEPARFKD